MAGSSRDERAATACRLAVALGLVVTLSGCVELDHIFDVPPLDCAAISRGPWQVSLARVEVQVRASAEASVTPGLPAECDASVVSVSWTVEDAGVANVMPEGKRSPRMHTAASIARAWVSGVAPGATRLQARVETQEGTLLEARPGDLTVVPPGDPPPGSFVVAEGVVDVSFNEFTGGGTSDLIPVMLPEAGRVDVTVDWISLTTRMGFFVWEGACVEVPCPGSLVIDAQTRPEKPRRETVEHLAPGEYTLRIFGIRPAGSGATQGSETAHCEVRLTPG